jgi:hypothetical protein
MVRLKSYTENSKVCQGWLRQGKSDTETDGVTLCKIGKADNLLLQLPHPVTRAGRLPARQVAGRAPLEINRRAASRRNGTPKAGKDLELT